MSGYDIVGAYTRAYNFQADRDNLIKIQAARMDTELDNMAAGFNLAYLRDGRAALTGNLDVGTYNVKNVGGTGSYNVGDLSFSFGNDATTGIFQSGLGNFSIACAGVQVFSASSQAIAYSPAALTAAGTPAPGLAFSQTWNNAAGNYTGFSISITNTNSVPATSRPFKVQVGGVTIMDLDTRGTLTLKPTNGFSAVDLSSQAQLAVGINSNALVLSGNGYALLNIADVLISGQPSLWMLANGVCTLISGAAPWVASTNAPGASQASIAYDGANYRVYVGNTTARGFRMAVIRY